MSSNESIVQRTFLALADLAARVADEEDITTDMLYQVVCEWTTDEITDDGPVGGDSMMLGSYMIEHLSTQKRLESARGVMESVITLLENQDFDPVKLAERDPEEWNRLDVAMAVGPDQEFSLDDAELTVDDILAVETNAPSEGDWEAVTNAAILEKVDYQAFMNEVISVFLQATIDGDHQRTHEIMEDLDCELVHGLTNMFLMWVRSRQTIGDDTTLVEWIAGLGAQADEIANMAEDERIEYGKNHFVGFDDLPD